MACLPLIERELRVALRKHQPAKGRLKIAGLAAGGSVLFLLIAVAFGDRSPGKALEQLLCALGLYLVFQAPALTAGVLAEERRNQTLGLLFLSGLGPLEVFISKFLSSALIAFTNLLAIFPMLALPFFIGSVSPGLFLATVFGLPTLMMFALAVSLLASVLTAEDGEAVILAFVIGAALCVLTPAIYIAEAHFAPGSKPSLWWLRISPAYGPRLIWNGFGTGFGPIERAEFWQNLLVTLLWSLMALVVAAFALKRLWRDQEVMRETTGWRERWQNFMHGSREERQGIARKWLDANPFVWLAGRDRQHARLGWLVIGGIAAVWLICWAAWPSQWPGAQNYFITAVLMNSVLAWLKSYTAAQSLAQPRHDGTYELLLTTSLDPGDIVRGVLKTLRLNFRPLANFVLSLEMLMLLGGLLGRQWNRVSLAEYFVVWMVLMGWTWSLGRSVGGVLRVMWAGLNCGRPVHSVLRASGFKNSGWSFFWLLFNLRNFRMGRGFQQFPSGTWTESFLVFLFGGLFLIYWICQFFIRRSQRMEDIKWNPKLQAWIRHESDVHEHRLIREFREIVREPLPDPHDPRFKKWNVNERFPWGWKVIQQQLHERLVRRES
jgi:ABC-type transport system involved in multi-copper enzyme maturation permease subunit